MLVGKDLRDCLLVGIWLRTPEFAVVQYPTGVLSPGGGEGA